MTPKEKRDAKNARHKRNEQRRRKRWFEKRLLDVHKKYAEWIADQFPRGIRY